MIQINYHDSRPIYEKVKDSLRQLIFSGALGEGEKLPSVRELAVSLTVNPIPVKAAMAAMGWCENFLRMPLTCMADAHKEKLFALMRAEGLI